MLRAKRFAVEKAKLWKNKRSEVDKDVDYLCVAMRWNCCLRFHWNTNIQMGNIQEKGTCKEKLLKLKLFFTINVSVNAIKPNMIDIIHCIEGVQTFALDSRAVAGLIINKCDIKNRAEVSGSE